MPNGGWSYSYDALSRLVDATCSGTASAPCAGEANRLELTWSYDRQGNRWTQGVAAGTGTAASASFAGKNNRMGATSYDAAGNLLSDGTHTYTWDAEERLVAVDGGATARYGYDADGRRVRRTANGTTVDDLLGPDGRVLSEYDESRQAWTRTEIAAGGRALGSYNPQTGATTLTIADELGTLRARTDLAGKVQERYTSLHFGDLLTTWNDNWQPTSPEVGAISPLHFTGKPRDPETGLDDFVARLYSSSLGRWMSPDWSAQAAPVPYAKLDNPQSLNLYAYVLNNPVTLTDADGHACKDPKKGCAITVQLRAFIPQKSVGEVVGFKGDGRGFTSASNASSRVATTATINTDPSANGGHPLQSSSTTVQPTTLTTPVGNIQRTASGPQMPQVSASQDRNGNVTLHVTENVRNPFQPAGQGIMANVDITIPQSGASASITGTLSGSPSFELNVSSQTGPTANIPVAGSSTNSVVFVKNLEEQRQVDVTGQVP